MQGREAILKCKGCMVARYCSQSCQDEDLSKHKKQCSLLLVEGKKKEALCAGWRCPPVLGSTPVLGFFHIQ